jgi:hypothetical protein
MIELYAVRFCLLLALARVVNRMAAVQCLLPQQQLVILHAMMTNGLPECTPTNSCAYVITQTQVVWMDRHAHEMCSPGHSARTRTFAVQTNASSAWMRPHVSWRAGERPAAKCAPHPRWFGQAARQACRHRRPGRHTPEKWGGSAESARQQAVPWRITCYIGYVQAAPCPLLRSPMSGTHSSEQWHHNCRTLTPSSPQRQPQSCNREYTFI